MENLGQIIKQRREEFGYTLKAISDKTRVPVAKLEAIENGDLKYFENDMSYVKFYVRYYCNALHLNFDDYKEELETALDKFSNTSQMLKQVEFEQVNSRVNDRTKKANKKSIRSKRNIDFSFISFVSIIVVLVAGLALVFFFMILPNLNQSSDPIITDDQRDVPSEIVDEVEDEVETPEVVDNTIHIEKLDTSDYQISNYAVEQEIQFVIEFKYDAYVRIRIDGADSLNPPSQLFKAGSTLDMKLDAQDGRLVEFYVGYMEGSVIKLDDQIVELDESVANKSGKVDFSFSFVGGEQ